jgi:hypothetical protein
VERREKKIIPSLSYLNNSASHRLFTAFLVRLAGGARGSVNSLEARTLAAGPQAASARATRARATRAQLTRARVARAWTLEAQSGQALCRYGVRLVGHSCIQTAAASGDWSGECWLLVLVQTYPSCSENPSWSCTEAPHSSPVYIDTPYTM